MAAAIPDDVTRWLLELDPRQPDSYQRLVPLIYDELRALAGAALSRERPDHTLQATALVNEAYLRLIDQTRVRWQNRAHFFAVAARLMRRILVDHARAARAAKRGAGQPRLVLDEQVAGQVSETSRAPDLVALDDALQELARFDPRAAEIVELRFFAGLTVDEAAEALGTSPATVKRDWTAAQAWLRTQLA